MLWYLACFTDNNSVSQALMEHITTQHLLLEDSSMQQHHQLVFIGALSHSFTKIWDLKN